MENDLFHILKELFFMIIGPIVGLFAWMVKRLYNRVDAMQDKITELDKSDAVQSTQLKDIKEDIHGLGSKQDKMNDKLDKILDKVRK